MTWRCTSRMDTDQRYVERADFYVRMAGESMPEWRRMYEQERADDPDDSMIAFLDEPLRTHHTLNEDVPIDGIVAFYFPDEMDNIDGTPWSFTFPFRDAESSTAPWFAFPDRPKWERQPVWKWTNADADPHENLTLKPSLGIGGDELCFHCYIRDGEVEWL